MANTVSVLSYANTFGDWVVTTNALTKENNDLASNNYTKPAGTLYLNDSTLGLQVGNNAIVSGNLDVQTNLRVGSQLDGNSAIGFFSSIQTTGPLSVGGNFTINGTTVYNTNTFTLSASSPNQNSFITVYRTPGPNAALRWLESSKSWDALNVNSGAYFRLLTTEVLSDSGNLNSSANVATSASIFSANSFLQANDGITLSASKTYTNTANSNLKLYTDNTILTANNNLKAYVDGTVVSNYTTAISNANTSLKSYVDGSVVTTLSGAIVTANTNLKAYSDGTFPTRSGTGATGTWAISITGVAANSTNSVYASTVGVNYNNSPNASYQVLWGSSNTVFGSSGFTVNPSTNFISGSSFVASNWFRSTGATGWQNLDYGGGIFMQDTTFVRTSGAKAFFCDQAIYAGGNIFAFYSDERLKTKLGNIDNALDSVCKLNGFRYTPNEKAKELGQGDDKIHLGVGAKEVEELFPEIVSLAPMDMDVKEDGSIVSKTGKNYMTVDYSRLVPVLIEAIKELKSEIDLLKNK